MSQDEDGEDYWQVNGGETSSDRDDVMVWSYDELWDLIHDGDAWSDHRLFCRLPELVEPEPEPEQPIPEDASNGQRLFLLLKRGKKKPSKELTWASLGKKMKELNTDLEKSFDQYASFRGEFAVGDVIIAYALFQCDSEICTQTEISTFREICKAIDSRLSSLKGNAGISPATKAIASSVNSNLNVSF